jgi:hypothetical protein
MLVLSLPQTPKSELFYVQASANSLITQSLQTPLALLPKGEDEVVGVLPWQQVSWHLIEVPQDGEKLLLSDQGTYLNNAAHKNKAHQLLQGLLEEQLLDDLTQLHWVSGKLMAPPLAKDPVLNATGSTKTSDPGPSQLWVACCSKTWLKETLGALEEHSITVHRLVPEFEPSLMSDDLYAMDGPMGLEFVLSNSSGVMGFPKQVLASLTTSLKRPFKVHFEPAVSDQMTALFQGETELQTRAQRLLQASQSSWDFARGEWGQGSAKRMLKVVQKAMGQFLNQKEWRLARLGLVLLLVINVLALNAWTWKEHASRQTQKDQLTQILKTAFPDIQVVVDPMVQMRRALVALQQKTATPNNGDFEHLLSAWALLSANNPGLDLQQVQTLRFQANELTVLWKGANPSVSNPGLQLPLELKDQGYEVDSDGKQTHLRWSMKP